MIVDKECGVLDRFNADRPCEASDDFGCDASGSKSSPSPPPFAAATDRKTERIDEMWIDDMQLVVERCCRGRADGQEQTVLLPFAVPELGVRRNGDSRRLLQRRSVALKWDRHGLQFTALCENT